MCLCAVEYVQCVLCARPSPPLVLTLRRPTPYSLYKTLRERVWNTRLVHIYTVVCGSTCGYQLQWCAYTCVAGAAR